VLTTSMFCVVVACELLDHDEKEETQKNNMSRM